MPANEHRQAIPVELVSGAMALCRAPLLILPIGQFGHNDAFRIAASVAPQWGWGIVFLAVGAPQLIAVWLDNSRCRRWAALAAMLLWLVWGSLLTVSSPASATAIATFGPMAVSQGWAAIRVRR